MSLTKTKRQMPRTLRFPRQEALRAFIVAKREAAVLTQEQVAEGLGEYQSFVARVESGERRIDVVELLALAEAIGFDPHDVIEHVNRA